MPKFAANLSMFNEHAFHDRLDAAAEAGFGAVEFLFPYDHPPEAIAERLKRNRLTQALFNLQPGRWEDGERGLAALPDRFAEFKCGVARALDYLAATGVKRVHMLAGNAARSDPKAPDGEELNFHFLFAEFDRPRYDGYTGCEYNPRAVAVEGLDCYQPHRSA
jgi:hydroxypyruvate isomerase